MSVLSAPASAQASAAELVRQHEVRKTFSALTGQFAPADTEAAYQIQDGYVARLLVARQTSLAGYKIAITTPAMRDMVGFQNSVSGRLLSDQVHRSGDTIRAGDSVRLIIEFEIAFQMADDLPISSVPWNAASIFEHVSCAYPALEIADDRKADYTSLNSAVLTLIADNAWNQGLVLGKPVIGTSPDALQALEGIAFIDGVEVGRGTGHDVLGHPLQALAWLANHLAGRDRSLQAGDIVTTGSLVRSQFPVAGQRISFRLPGFGEVDLAVE